MLRYIAVSTAAKAFSLNSITRRAYRRLGNIVLERIRVAGGLGKPYIDRAVRLVDTCDRYSILPPGSRVLELGTGWVHWEATILRLFFDVEVTLYDVGDNRLLGAYQSWLGELGTRIDDIFGHLPEERRAAARQLIRLASSAQSFDEIYARLDFSYVLDPTGTLDGVDRDTFDLVVSADVLEHVRADSLPAYLDTLRRCLVESGWSVHQIDLVDHFSYFDPSCSPKNYYRYSDASWIRWFESDVQYFNRVQRPTWMRMFDDAELELVEEIHVTDRLAPLTLSSAFRGLEPVDLECMQLLAVHRRPGASAVNRATPRSLTG